MKGSVLVSIDIPVRLQLRENYSFRLVVPDFGEVRICLTDLPVPRSEEENHGTNINDRRGTFVRSRAAVKFEELLDLNHAPPELEDYSVRALEVVNKLIEAYRYVTKDHTVRKVARPEVVSVRVVDEFGKPLPCSPLIGKRSFGLGVRLRTDSLEEEHKKIEMYLSGREEMNLARSLLVDAQNHTDSHDFQHAIFDIATALEVFIDRFLDRNINRANNPKMIRQQLSRPGIYWLYDKGLAEVTGVSLHSKPDLFIKLEYIRVIRNNVVHHREAKFTTKGLSGFSGGYKSKYLDQHRLKEGHEVKTKKEIQELRLAAEQIMDFVDSTLGVVV
jgi:hypothetical protein